MWVLEQTLFFPHMPSPALGSPTPRRQALWARWAFPSPSPPLSSCPVLPGVGRGREASGSTRGPSGSGVMSVRHPLRSPEAASGLPAPARGFSSLARPRSRAAVPGSRGAGGGHPVARGPLCGAPSPPAICIQDGLSTALLGFLVIIPHALQPCLLRAACPASAWPAVAVAELDKASASPPEPPPGAPSGGKAASSPGPAALCLAWGRGGAPGPGLLASAASRRPPGPHTARIVCGSAAPRRGAHTLSALLRPPRPTLGVCREPWAGVEPRAQTPPPLPHRVRDALAPRGGGSPALCSWLTPLSPTPTEQFLLPPPLAPNPPPGALRQSGGRSHRWRNRGLQGEGACLRSHSQLWHSRRLPGQSFAHGKEDQEGAWGASPTLPGGWHLLDDPHPARPRPEHPGRCPNPELSGLEPSSGAAEPELTRPSAQGPTSAGAGNWGLADRARGAEGSHPAPILSPGWRSERRVVSPHAEQHGYPPLSSPLQRLGAAQGCALMPSGSGNIPVSWTGHPTL